MLNLLFYLLLMGITLYVAAIYSSVAFVFLFCVELAIICVDMFLLIYNRIHAKVSLLLPHAAAEKGKEVPIELVVNNKGVFPVAKEVIYLKYRTTGRKRMETLKFTVSAHAGEELHFTNQLVSEYSGSFYFEKAIVVIYDPLRIFHIKKSFQLQERLDILPDIYSTGIVITEPVRHFMGESEVYDNMYGGDDASWTFKLREFRAGDKLKDIHWKLSAKEGEWIVREKGLSRACAVVLFLDFATEKRGDIDALDQMLSVAASISFSLLEENCPHYIAWYREAKQEMARIRVDNEEMLYLFLMTIFEETISIKKMDLLELYREQYKGETFLSDICVDMRLQVTLCGEPAGTCDGARLEESIGKLLLHL